MSDWAGTGSLAEPIGDTYIDYAYVLARMTGLADTIPTGETAATWVTTWIVDAQAQVDAALKKLYTVPFTEPIPALVKRVTFQLTQYLILRENYRGEDPNVSDWVDEYRKDAERLLAQLASGELEIDKPIVDENASQSSTTGLAQDFQRTTHDSEGTIVTEGNMEVW
jgi:phage gp36-like protein